MWKSSNPEPSIITSQCVSPEGTVIRTNGSLRSMKSETEIKSETSMSEMVLEASFSGIMYSPGRLKLVSPGQDSRNVSFENSSITHTVEPPDFPGNSKTKNKENLFDAQSASNSSADLLDIKLLLSKSYFLSVAAAATFLCSGASTTSSRT